MRTATIILVLVAASGCKRPAGDAAHEGPTSVEVHCVEPTRQTVEETTALRGRIEPPPGGDLSVASQVGGRVVAVSV